MKTIHLILPLVLASVAGLSQAESLRGISVVNNGSYALDADSIVQSNGKTAFTVLTNYTNKMKAPNGAEYIKASNTFLADCKAKTQALTGVTLMDGVGKTVYTYTPTPAEAPMITPERNSLDDRIMQMACRAK